MASVIDEIVATAVGGFTLVKQDKIYRQQRNFDRSYYVVGDDLNDRESQACTAVGIPQIGFILQGAICRGVKAKELDRVKNPFNGNACALFQVDCSFDNDYNEEDADESNQAPEARTPKVRWYGENDTEELSRDAITGKAITTTAGEKIIVEHPIAFPILEIKRYGFAPFDPDVILQYVNRTNSTVFWGAPKGSALMLPITADEVTIDGGKYVEETYTIKFKPKTLDNNETALREDSWKGSVLNQGQMVRLAPDTEPVRATDDNDNPITVNLDDDGVRLADGADPVYVDFNRFARANFNNLNLGPF